MAGSAATAAGFGPVEPYEYSADYLRGTLGYYNVDDDFGDFSEFYGDIEGERQYGKVLAFGGVGFFNNDDDDGVGLELGAGYYVTPNVLVGAQILSYSSDSDSGTDYAIFAQYEGQNGAIAISFNDPDDDEEFLVVSGEYMFSGQTSVSSARYHEDDYNNLSVNFEHTAGATTYNLVVDIDDDNYRGALLYIDHHFNYRTRVFGAVGGARDSGFSGNFAAIGAGYKVADNLWLEGAVGRFDSDSNDGTVVAINLTYEIGKSKRVERRVTNSYRDIYEGIGYLAEF